jgi:hypothetical protein
VGNAVRLGETGQAICERRRIRARRARAGRRRDAGHRRRRSGRAPSERPGRRGTPSAVADEAAQLGGRQLCALGRKSAGPSDAMGATRSPRAAGCFLDVPSSRPGAEPAARLPATVVAPPLVQRPHEARRGRRLSSLPASGRAARRWKSSTSASRSPRGERDLGLGVGGDRQLGAHGRERGRAGTDGHRATVPAPASSGRFRQ